MQKTLVSALLLLASNAFAAPFNRDAVLSEASRIQTQTPAYTKQLDSLRGLDPTYYKTWRKPEPEVGRELVRLRLPAEVLVARYYAAPGLSLSDAERDALVQGLLMAVSKTDASFRGAFLASVANDASLAVAWRERAARELGYSKTEEAWPTLRELAVNERTPLTLRVAALSGLGAVRTPESLAVLASLVSAKQSEDVQRGAVTALGTLGSHGSRDVPDALREQVAMTLVERALFQLPALETSVLEALSVAAHPKAQTALVALSKDTRYSAKQRDLAERAQHRVIRGLAGTGSR